MKYIKVINGNISNNTYLLYNDKKQCIIIDPSIESDVINKKIVDNELEVVGILLTHAHYDHIYSTDFFVELYNVDVYCDEVAIEYIKNPSLNLSSVSANAPGKVVVRANAKKALPKFKLGDFEITAFKTPGHTKACVTYLIDEYAFTGDFVFKGTIGRVDFFDSSMEKMIDSINRFSKLNIDYFILPGHGEESTLEIEKKSNKFFIKYGENYG